MSYWPRILLLGDSITQYSMQVNGWGAAISQQVQRKCDVINRGFSGYNTTNILSFIDQIIGEDMIKNLAAVTVFLGANDSVLPESYSKQHVPVEKYGQNLTKIVEKLVSLGVDVDKVIIISPPAMDPEARLQSMIEKGNGDMCDRSNEVTLQYATSSMKVAQTMKCRSVDLYRAMAGKDLSLYLSDGLHLSDGGNDLLATLLEPHILQLTSHLPMNLPDWKDL